MPIVKLNVRRTSWRSLTIYKLPNYANNVVNRTKDEPRYDPLREKLLKLDAKSKALSAVLDNTMIKGQLAKTAKQNAKNELYDALESVAIGLEDYANDAMYILEAGMEIQLQPTRKEGELLAVTKVTASSNGQKGQAIVQFICPREQRSQVQTFGVEWSDDNGVTRHNGTYKNSERILMTGLPNRKDIRFWVCCIGTHGRKSEWSDFAEVFVV